MNIKHKKKSVPVRLSYNFVFTFSIGYKGYKASWIELHSLNNALRSVDVLFFHGR
jgi:hypothetical protein